MMQDRVDDALRACEAGLAEVPGAEALALSYVSVLQSQNRQEDAVAFMDRWVPENPDVTSIFNIYSNALENLGRTNDAIAACRQGIAVEPFYPELHFNLGRMLAGQNRFVEALPILDAAAEQFSRQETEFAARWRDSARSMAELVRNEITTGRGVLSGSREAASPQEWNLAVFMAIQDDRPAELASFVSRTLDGDPTLATGWSSGAPVLAAGTLLDWSVAEACPDPVASRATALRLVEHMVERSAVAIRTRSSDVEVSRWSLDTLSRMPSFDPVRGEVLEALPAVEREAWTAIWKTIAELRGN